MKRKNATPITLGTDPAAFLGLTQRIETRRLHEQRAAANTLPAPEDWPAQASSPSLPPLATWAVLGGLHLLFWVIAYFLK